MAGDIGGAYLNANTEENIFSYAGPKFEPVVIVAEVTLVEVIKAMYWLKTSGNTWHMSFCIPLGAWVFKTNPFFPRCLY